MTILLQLSYGLSSEYAKKPQASENAKFNAERQLYSKYYISQILQMGEEGIHDAWSKVRSLSTRLQRCGKDVEKAGAGWRAYRCSSQTIA